MAKLLTIKLSKDGVWNIGSRVPDGMTGGQVNEKLTEALPLAVAGLAYERSQGSTLAARADILTMFEKADRLVTMMFEEEEDADEDYDDGGAESDDLRHCECGCHCECAGVQRKQHTAGGTDEA